MRMSGRQFEEAVRDALAEVPAQFAPYLENVIVDVEAVPDVQMLEEMGIEEPEDLLGVYLGTPLTERSVDAATRMPDRIVIYKENLESMCRNRRELVEEIRRTVLHEVGHHFGLDEDDLDDLGYG